MQALLMSPSKMSPTFSQVFGRNLRCRLSLSENPILLADESAQFEIVSFSECISLQIRFWVIAVRGGSIGGVVELTASDDAYCRSFSARGDG